MAKNSDVLIGIYKKAKSRRIVLNQSEFAKALGYSRVHLFDKMIKHEKEIPNELIEKASKILSNTNNVSRETNGIPVTKEKGEFYSEVTEREMTNEAAIKVLRAQVIELSVKLSNRSYSEVSLEVDRLMQDELKHALRLLKKK